MSQMLEPDYLVNDDTIDEAQEEALLKSDDDPMEAASDSSDDHEKDEENQQFAKFLEILNLIDQNKYVYDNYIRLIEAAHKLSDLEKIRQSCELFSSVYPLSPEIWLRWLKIEMNLATSENEIEDVIRLFRRALNDYYSSNVALEFAHFLTKSKNADEIWPELLEVYALHCFEGRKIFELWRKYIHKKDIDIKEKRQILMEMYKRELEIPLYDMEETYIESKMFYEKNKDDLNDVVDWAKIDEKYNRAKNHLQKMLSFENQLNALNPSFHQERAEIYKTYLLKADHFIDENILQTIYERMVTDCCLNPTCWLEYIQYLEIRDKYGRPKELGEFSVFLQTSMDIINRGLRNCTWSERLYIKKMHLAEKQEFSKVDIQKVFESALEAGFQTPEPTVTLWLEYLAFLRRHTDYTDEKEVDILRANFNLSWNSLGKQWGVLADCNCEILQFWGRLEYGPLQDTTKGKELWITVMESSDNALKSGLWIEFAHLELKRGPDAARKIYRKALNITEIDNPHVITSAWMRFERCNGTLEQVTICQNECETVLKTVETQKKQQNRQVKLEKKLKTSKATAITTMTKRKANNDILEMSLVDDSSKFKKPIKKVKTSEEFTKQSDFQNNGEIDKSLDHLRIFLSNLDYNITEDEIRNSLPELQITNINLIKAVNGRGRGFGYIELKDEGEINKAIEFDRRMIAGRPVYISSILRDKEQRPKFKYSDTLEPTKLFVKGLPFDCTKDELQNLFKTHGDIKDIRLVYHKSGKPKGIAYVEYVKESDASHAVLKLDQHDMRGFQMNVAISAPPSKPTIKEATSITKSLGNGKRFIPRGEQKPRMTLIPTSVRKNILNQPTPPNGVTTTMEKKSNNDFRKLLNKK